ncbi:MAG: alpha/beta hydrolase [Candidatus Aminicenantes bacterium]|nr:alpha/beta hydrolase [Candidatus Aminicenantes bacterium]
MKKMKHSLELLFFVTMIVFLPAFPQTLHEEDITVYKDIVYAVADGHELKLDIAVPKCLKAPAPAIVDIPGGAWRVIHKSADDALYYAKFGFIGVSITHRTSDIAPFPAAVHDCKTVIRWLRAHAEKYCIDPDKIGVTGFSSGGHLAVLLGTSGGDAYLEGKGGYEKYSSRVQAVVDHFGPTDFLKMNDTDQPDKMDVFSPDSAPSLFLGGPLKEKADLARLANPIKYIDPEDPPVLIGHGEKDGMVGINQSEILYEALKKAGVPTKFVRVKNADHMYRPTKWNVEVSPTVETMNRMTVEWFEKWLGKPELDLTRIQPRKPKKERSQGKKIAFSYRLTFELPDMVTEGNCVGRFMVKAGNNILQRGNIQIDDLSSRGMKTFIKKFELYESDLIGKNIMWNFQGEIYVSLFDKTSQIMYMQGEKYDSNMVGVGYVFRIHKDKTIDIEKKVYRKK